MKPAIKLSESQIQDIISKYQNDKLSTVKIGKLFAVPPQRIQRILIKNNVKLRPIGNKSWFNENYFEKIDSEGKAYLLGFILADGCISKNSNPNINWQGSLSIQIHPKDYYILDFLKSETESSKKVVYYKNRNTCKFSLVSNKLCEDLKKLGVTANKTFTAKFPNSDQIPDHLFHHFMRGLFDGDGCISVFQPKNKNTIAIRFDICGTFDICKGVQNTLNHIIVNEDLDKTIHRQGKIYRIFYSKNQSQRLIYNYLYGDATIFLTRKKEKFEKVFDPQIRNMAYTSNINKLVV